VVLRPGLFLNASHWERAHYPDYTQWCARTDLPDLHFSAITGAVAQTLTTLYARAHADAVAVELPRVLKSCDDLNFNSLPEAIAYLGLHLSDRYGRVTQVLEHLLETGHIPIRRRRTAVLEVGAGPAPSIYAAYCFYLRLQAYAAQAPRRLRLAPVDAQVIDIGAAWDEVLHHFSEHLLTQLGLGPGMGFPLPPFRRTHNDLKSYSAVSTYLMAREPGPRQS